MDLVNATARFLHRHRRALTIGVGIGVAGYAVYKIKRWREEYYQMMKELDDARFDQRRYASSAFGWIQEEYGHVGCVAGREGLDCVPTTTTGVGMLPPVSPSPRALSQDELMAAACLSWPVAWGIGGIPG